MVKSIQEKKSPVDLTVPDVDPKQLVLPLALPAKGFHFMPDTHGKIKHLFIGYEHNVVTFLPSLLDTMGPERQYTIIAKDSGALGECGDFLGEHGYGNWPIKYAINEAFMLPWMREMASAYEGPVGFALVPGTMDSHSFGELLDVERRYFRMEGVEDEGRLLPKG
ncbi:MAG: hypothetical protein V1703_04960, partial [Candidatus Altiarchaeota archaeon]